MPVAKKKARTIGIGQVWEEFSKGETKRFVRIESMTRTEAVCSERFSTAGRFSSVTSRIPIKSFRRPRFVLWHEAA